MESANYCEFINSDSDDGENMDDGEELPRKCINVTSFTGTPIISHLSYYNNKIQLCLTQDRSIYMLAEDNFITLFKYLSNNDKLNVISTSKRFMSIIGNSRPILRRVHLTVDKHTLLKLTQHRDLKQVPFQNIEIDLQINNKLNDIVNFYRNFKHSVKSLIVKNGKFKNFASFFEIIGNLPNAQSLSFVNCHIECLKHEVLPEIPSLTSISLEKCNDNIFKTLINQKTIKYIHVKNNDWTWNGFAHEIFNVIVRNSNNHIKEIKFEGAGTESYFDSDEFPFKIAKLDTSMITFHWYVGIKTERVSFLRTQIGFLKDLTIHQLPNDFDGGRVMKFIFDHMNLQNFYYGKTALIVGGKKQQVERIEVTEIQIQCMFELVRQFPSITSICLNLSATDIASDEIEKVINPPSDLFKNILEFEVIDNSKYRGVFGVFLGLLKKFINVRKLTFKTPDRNINVLLEECLPYMGQVNEIYLTSTANRSNERFTIIKRFAPCLSKISVDSQYLEEAKTILGPSVNVCMI